MRYLSFLVPVIILIASACGTATDKQWYKPNADYTTADFERDRVDCTPKRSNTLDETCMKDRGWLSLSGDTGPAFKAPVISPHQKGNKY
jgi:hypothetical protein